MIKYQIQTSRETIERELLDSQMKKIDKAGDKETVRETFRNEDKELEQSYALEEALGHYKSSDFDPSAKLTIQYRGQTAIETGGVLRQFYTDVFDQMIDGGEDVPPLFEGSDHKKLHFTMHQLFYLQFLNWWENNCACTCFGK